MKKSLILALTLLSAVILSGCQSAQTEGHFFHDYLVSPFVELIHSLGVMLGNYGLAVIVITIAVRLILIFQSWIGRKYFQTHPPVEEGTK